MLLNHLLSTYLYSHRLVYLSILIREALSYPKRWWLNETLATGQCAEDKITSCLILNRTSLPKTPDDPKAQGSSWKKWQRGFKNQRQKMTTVKQCLFGHNLAAVYINSLWLSLHRQDYPRSSHMKSHPSWSAIGSWWLLGKERKRVSFLWGCGTWKATLAPEDSPVLMLMIALNGLRVVFF